MTEKKRILLIAIPLVAVIAVLTAWYISDTQDGRALDTALQTILQQKSSEQAVLARAILDNYGEIRGNARHWSAAYWGCAFLAAALSAAAGLILKLETLVKDNEGLKKDVAAFFSVAAAVLITISTSGDFHKKWQANRNAAAGLEQMGYELMHDPKGDPHPLFEKMGEILHERQMIIIGYDTQQRAPSRPST